MDQEIKNININMSVFDSHPKEKNINKLLNNIAPNKSMNYSSVNPCELNYNNNKDQNGKIIKNIITEDKLLHVFIKYIPISILSYNKEKNRLLTKNNNKNNNNGKCLYNNIHIESITLLGKDVIYNKEEFDKNNKNNINKENKDNNRYNEEEDNLVDCFDNIKNNKKIKSSTLKSTDNNKNNNNNTSDNKDIISNNHNNIYINEDMNNSLCYLISLLQNMYDDIKKSILYTFFKNLRKIKTNSLFYNSIKNKGKTSININQSNFIKDIRNKKKTFNEYLKLTKKTSTKNDINININKTIQDNSFDINKKVIKNKNDININTSFRNNNKLSLNLNLTTINDNNKKTKKKSTTNEINDEKENIKKKKLAKLGKIFNNLNQENNIINAIKEQFLDWNNKNDLLIKNNCKSNNNKYQVKTFNFTQMINNKKDETNNNNFCIKELNDEFERKIKVFRNKLIKFYLDKKYHENEFYKRKKEKRIYGKRKIDETKK